MIVVHRIIPTLTDVALIVLSSRIRDLVRKKSSFGEKVVFYASEQDASVKRDGSLIPCWMNIGPRQLTSMHKSELDERLIVEFVLE